MANPNISRNSFDETKNYVKMIQQQGMPVVDYDLNEAQDILRYLLRMSMQFLIGTSAFDDNAFKVVGTGLANNFTIKAGKALLQGNFFYKRTDSLASEHGIVSSTAVGSDRTDCFYLDLWFEEIDYTQDPNIKHPDLPLDPSQRLKIRVDEKYIENSLNPPSAPEGHVYIKVAEILRPVGQNSINAQDVIDKRNVIKSTAFIDLASHIANSNIHLNQQQIESFTVKNAGGTPSIKAGTLGDRPAATGSGSIYIVTDAQPGENTIFRDAGSDNWVAIGGGGGSTLRYYLNSVPISVNTNNVPIGIPEFNHQKDILWVFRNTTFLQKDEKYVIAPDGISITKVDSPRDVGVNWVAPAVFDFVVLKVVNEPPSGEIDPAMLPEKGITINKLSQGIQDSINNINVYVDEGTDPDYVGVKYKLVVKDGQPYMEVIEA